MATQEPNRNPVTAAKGLIGLIALRGSHQAGLIGVVALSGSHQAGLIGFVTTGENHRVGRIGSVRSQAKSAHNLAVYAKYTLDRSAPGI